jgi:hypothetical protein
MKTAIAVAIALAISAATPVGAVTNGRKGFCAGETNYKACVNANRGAKKRHHSPEAYTACAELAEYVNAEERREWERCLAKHDRASKGRAER